MRPGCRPDCAAHDCLRLKRDRRFGRVRADLALSALVPALDVYLPLTPVLDVSVGDKVYAT